MPSRGLGRLAARGTQIARGPDEGTARTMTGPRQARNIPGIHRSKLLDGSLASLMGGLSELTYSRYRLSRSSLGEG